MKNTNKSNKKESLRSYIIYFIKISAILLKGEHNSST